MIIYTDLVKSQLFVRFQQEAGLEARANCFPNKSSFVHIFDSD